MLTSIKKSVFQSGCTIYYCQPRMGAPCWGPVIRALERMGTKVDPNGSGGATLGPGIGKLCFSLYPLGLSAR